MSTATHARVELPIYFRWLGPLEAERKSIALRLAAWVKMAEAEPGSPTIMQQLRQLEAEQERVEHAIRDSESNAKVKRWLSSMTPEDARQMIETCRIEDGATVDQRRAALAALVDRIEFDPAKGTGRVLYRVGLNGTKFDVRTSEAKELVSSYRGMVASPRQFDSIPLGKAISYVKIRRAALSRGGRPRFPRQKKRTTSSLRLWHALRSPSQRRAARGMAALPGRRGGDIGEDDIK